MIRNALSLDCETYGVHTAFPAQSTFSAPRFRWVDNPLHSLLTVALTTVAGFTPGAASAALIASMRPGPTTVLPFVDPVPLARRPIPEWFSSLWRETEARLLRWLTWADTILGMNLGFDLAVLCFHSPLIRELIRSRQHLLIDLSCVNFLDNPDRSERSLKSIGPVIGTHVYDKTARDRFDCIVDAAEYNGCDTHNSVLAIAELARRINNLPEPGRSLKLSPFTLLSFSDTIHLTVDMTLAGVPYSRDELYRLHDRLSTRQRRTHTLARRRHNLLIANLEHIDGSKKSKSAFFDRLVAEVDAYWFDPSHPRDFPYPGLPPKATTVLDHPRVALTPKTREISHSDANRAFLASLLPATSSLHKALLCWDRYSAAAKLNGSYCYPLLFHSVNNHKDRSSILVPQPGVAWSPLLTPSPFLPEVPCPTPKKTRSKSTSTAAPAPTPSPPDAATTTTPNSPSPTTAPPPATTPTPSPSPTASPTPSSPPGFSKPTATPTGATSTSPPPPF